MTMILRCSTARWTTGTRSTRADLTRSGPDSLHSLRTGPEPGRLARRGLVSLLLLGVAAYYLWLGFQPGEFKAFHAARMPWVLATLMG